MYSVHTSPSQQQHCSDKRPIRQANLNIIRYVQGTAATSARTPTLSECPRPVGKFWLYFIPCHSDLIRLWPTYRSGFRNRNARERKKGGEQHKTTAVFFVVFHDATKTAKQHRKKKKKVQTIRTPVRPTSNEGQNLPAHADREHQTLTAGWPPRVSCFSVSASATCVIFNSHPLDDKKKKQR